MGVGEAAELYHNENTREACNRKTVDWNRAPFILLMYMLQERIIPCTSTGRVGKGETGA